MRFLHTGDWHIGKTVNGFSMLEEQKHFLQQILEIGKKEQVDAIVAAGDIYDRSIPSAEAVLLLNGFLVDLEKANIKFLCISGNHDSPERLGFGESLLEKQNVFIGSLVENGIKKVSLKDEYGFVDFFLLPFVKPAAAGGKNSEEAVELLLKDVELGERNVLITHYFVTSGGKSPELSDSETTLSVGGLDRVEAKQLKDFDYVALGHIHKPQKIGEGEIYYAGSPMKYSFSECSQEKGVNLVNMEEKGKLTVTRCSLNPLHDMRKIKGKLEQLISPEIVKAGDCMDYIQATVLNQEELLDPIGTLRNCYPNIMQLLLAKNELQEAGNDLESLKKSKSILELFSDFYETVREEPLPADRREIVLETIHAIDENV